MAAFSLRDLGLLISENYLTFLLLGGLLVVMYAYRDIHLPATRNFLFIILVLFLMSITNSLERWAVLGPDRRTMRIAMSVLHYCLQPCVIWLELIIIIPRTDRNYKRKIFLLSLPLIVNTIIYLIAPWFGELVFWYREDYAFCRGPLGYSIYIVTFFYLILLLQVSLHFLRQNDRRKAIILFFLVFSGVLTGILEGMNLITGYIDEAFALGVFLYYMYLVTVHEQEMKAALAKKELELSEEKVKLLQEQIRPHFIFNSLHIIKALIRTEPEKAIQGVEDFSDYLQANLEVMTTNKLIPFEDELDHIRAFVSLALADESKGITVTYDIQEQYFLVPPLTIEPLVENAIQHGVPKGGNVLLSTCLDGNAHRITVSDDGRGMGAGAETGKPRSGISLENVKTRLAIQCNGTLEIESGDRGTVVTVLIPKKRGGKSSNNAISGGGMRVMKILIVDDEKLIVDDLIHEVRELYPSPEAQIDGTTSASDALKMAEETEYDIALLDIDMPDMDGLNLARRLIASCPVINIIFVTGYEAYALEAHEMYCSAFLIKPVSRRKLQKAFENLRRPFFDVSPEFLEKHYSGEAVIGKRIEMYRNQRGLSGQELADLMNVSRQTVYRWEQGDRMPDVLTFLKLARVLGVRMEDLLGAQKPADG